MAFVAFWAARVSLEADGKHKGSLACRYDSGSAVAQLLPGAESLCSFAFPLGFETARPREYLITEVREIARGPRRSQAWPSPNAAAWLRSLQPQLWAPRPDYCAAWRPGPTSSLPLFALRRSSPSR